jgi:hypothetical protein
MMERTEFLKAQDQRDASKIVANFRSLSKDDAAKTDRWLLWASCQGSMTHPERYLYDWINESEEAGEMFS